jgi:uncharacterized protein DUF5667
VLVVTTSVFDKRRAERFAQLLDEATGARRHHTRSSARRHHVRSAADDKLSDLMTLTYRVSTVPLAVEVDPEFRTGLRASLMARIEREGIGATAVAPEADVSRRRRVGLGLTALLPSARARGALLVALAGGTLAVSGVSAASAGALPGDTLYGIKRSTENAQIAFAREDVSRGLKYLDLSKVRLDEARKLLHSSARLSGVLDDMDGEMRHGTWLLTKSAVERGDVAALEAIEQFVDHQRSGVMQLAGQMNGPSRGRVADSLNLLNRISARVAALKPAIKCKIGQVALDELGALPKSSCAHASPRTQSAQNGGAQNGAVTQTSPGAATTGGKPVTVPGVDPSVEAETPTVLPSPSPSSSSGGLLQHLGKLFGDLIG